MYIMLYVYVSSKKYNYMCVTHTTAKYVVRTSGFRTPASGFRLPASGFRLPEVGLKNCPKYNLLL